MLGETIFSLQLGDVTLSKTVYEPGMVMGAHVHQLPYVSLVVAGRYTKHRRDAPCQLRRDMLVFHPAGEEHADCVHDVPLATVNIEYRSRRLPGDFLCAQGPDVDALTHRLLSALDEAQPNLIASIAAIDAFLWRRSVRNEPSARMLLARNALAQRDQRHSVAAIARDLEMHRVVLHRTFKATYGDSLRADAAKRRFAAAAMLLTTSSAAIAEIAAECGYYDQSHFCRQFKRWTGLSPSRYRLVFAA